MTGIKVSVATSTIEVSKKFATAAAKYGTKEYEILQEVRRDYEGFQVVEVARKTPKSTKNSFKGLTYEYMETYILSHDDEEQTAMMTYLNLRGETEEAEAANALSQSYMEIKDWFLAQYPEIAAFHQTRIQMVEAAQKKHEKERIAKQIAAKTARRNALLSRKTA